MYYHTIPTYSFTVLEEVIIEAESETVKAAESFVVMQDLTGIRSGHVSYMGRMNYTVEMN